MSALCQLLTTVVADFVSLACDWKYHSIDYFTHWVSNMRLFLTYILIVITLGSSRCVLLLKDLIFLVSSTRAKIICRQAFLNHTSEMMPCRLCVELLMLFCPTFTDDNGVLLYYCDKPSLFGRIGKSGS